MPTFLHRGVVLAAALVIPAMTLAACSSDESTDQANTSSSAAPALPMPISSSLLTVPPAQQAPKDTGIPSPGTSPNPVNPSEEKPAGDTKAGTEGDKASAPAPKPPAPGSDEEQITALVTDMYQQETWSGFVKYMPSHSCQELVAQNGLQDPVELDDTPLEQMPNFDRSQTGIEEVKNIQVDGNRATATVVSKAQGEVSSTEVVFAKENNQWTFCK